MINIQVFTDGGVFKRGRVGVSVALAYIDRKRIMKCTKLSFNKGSDFVELFAINKALSRLYGYCNQRNILNEEFHINIFTDSLTSIEVIQSNKYMNEDNSLKEAIINEIRQLIIKLNNNVTFYHIKSHVSNNNLKAAYIKYCMENQVDIPFNEFLFIQQQNKKCDNIVSKEYKKYHKQKKIQEGLTKKQQKELEYMESLDIDMI